MLAHLARLLRNAFRKRQLERDLDSELQSMLAEAEAENIRNGMPPEEARRAAAVAFGGTEQVKEQVRDARTGAWLEQCAQDMRHGLRLVARAPGFSLVVVLTLALGIGANTAIFSVVHAVLLNPLPFTEPERIVHLTQTYPQRQLNFWTLSQANYAAYATQARSFESTAAFTWTGFNLTGAGDDAQRLQAATVTADFFNVFGVPPAMGRTFYAGEDTEGKNIVCVISDGFWRSQFARDPHIIGKLIHLNNVATEIVGVMPPTFKYPDPLIRIWVPLAFEPQRKAPFYLLGIGRLRAGVTAEQAQSETTALLRNLARNDAQFAGSDAPVGADADIGTVVRPLLAAQTEATRKPLLVLQSAVALVLLIACANVANLLLSRSLARRREIAMRLALGATPGRIVRQFLGESLVLGGVAAALGLAFVAALNSAIAKLSAGGVPRLSEAKVDAPVLAFAGGVTLLVWLLFGLAPALRARKLGLAEGLQGAGRTTGARHERHANRFLVAGQMALSMVLLVGAGLLLASFARLTAVNPGFDFQNLITLRIVLPQAKYAGAERPVRFYAQLVERVRSLPGVESAAVVSQLAFTNDSLGDGIVVEGHEPPPNIPAQISEVRFVTPDWFHTMRVPLQLGRDFNAGDRADAPQVAIVDETLARRYWSGGNDALGKRVRFAWDESPTRWMTIVGIAAPLRDNNLAEVPSPHLYMPHSQSSQRRMSLVVRTAAGADRVAADVRTVMRELDRDVPVFAIATMSENVGESLRAQRLTNTLLAIFALAALLLAAIGTFGVISLETTSRMREFGIRLALGARPRELFQMVVAQGLKWTAAGIAAGILGALALARFISTMLFEVTPTNPAVFTGVALLLAAVTFLACWLPARRATRVDPVEVLRND